MKELIILEGIDTKGFDEFMVVSGERIETETDPNFYPFEHAVTFCLCHRDAVRVGQKIITVAESAILEDCELPTAEAVTQGTEQLTLFGDTQPKQLSLF